MNRFFKQNGLPLLAGFVYEGVATLTICSSYGSDALGGEWVIWATFFTFPALILSFGVRFAEPDMMWLVYLLQSIMFVVFFFIFKRVFKKGLTVNPNKNTQEMSTRE